MNRMKFYLAVSLFSAIALGCEQKGVGVATIQIRVHLESDAIPQNTEVRVSVQASPNYPAVSGVVKNGGFIDISTRTVVYTTSSLLGNSSLFSLDNIDVKSSEVACKGQMLNVVSRQMRDDGELACTLKCKLTCARCENSDHTP